MASWKFRMCFSVKGVPEKRGRVSSGYMLASWMESWDRLTLYRGGRGPCVPYKIFPGFCSTIRLEYAHSLDSSTCTHDIDLLQKALQDLGYMLLYTSLCAINKYVLFGLCGSPLCIVCTCISCMEISYISLLVSEALNNTRLSKVTRSHG